MKLNFSNLGWIVTAALLGLMMGSGFQAPTLKIGTADLDKVMQNSDYWKSNEATYNDYAKKRQDLLSFYSEYPMLSSDEVGRIKDLWLNDSPTVEQKAQLDTLRSQADTEQKREKELSVKDPLTPEERTELNQYTTREQANRQQTFPQMEQDFTQDVSTKRQGILSQAMDKARQAVAAVGKAQGYTILFSSAAAPYSSNDVTDDSTKAMNAQK